MSTKSTIYSALADLFTQLASAEEAEEAKSPNTAVDAVAGSSAGSKGKKATPPAEVAAKPAAKSAKPKAAAITFEVLKAKLTELVNAKGKEAAKEILSGFGAPKLVDLDEENYTEAHSQAVAAMAEEEPDDTSGDADDMFGD